MPLETCPQHTHSGLSVHHSPSVHSACPYWLCSLLYPEDKEVERSLPAPHLDTLCKSGQPAYSILSPQCYRFRKGCRNQVCHGEMAGNDAFLLLDLSWNNIIPDTVGGHHPERAWLGMRTTQRKSLLRNGKKPGPEEALNPTLQ